MQNAALSRAPDDIEIAIIPTRNYEGAGKIIPGAPVTIPASFPSDRLRRGLEHAERELLATLRHIDVDQVTLRKLGEQNLL